MKRNSKFYKSISKVLAFVMTLGVMVPATVEPAGIKAADALTWKVDNSTSVRTAVYGDTGLTYYSTDDITSGSSGGKNYVKATAINGSASSGIVVTNNKSYAKYVAPADGVWTVYVGKANGKEAFISCNDGTTDTAIGSFKPGTNDSKSLDKLEVVDGATWATANVDVTKGVTYYVTVSGSKMFCYGMEFVPNTIVKGSIDNSIGASDLAIKFTEKTTGKVVNAVIDGSSYTVSLKAGDYTASLVGESAAQYTVSSESKNVKISASSGTTNPEITANLVIVENEAAKVSGNLTGFADGYNISDLKLVFEPQDTSAEKIDVEINGNEYSAMLSVGMEYTLKMVKGACDYELASEVKITPESKADITKDVEFKAVALYDVTGGFLGLGELRGEYVTLNVTPDSIKFINVDDNYEYAGTAADGKYSAKLRNGSYLAQISSDSYSTSTHVVIKDGKVERNLLLKDNTKKNVEFSSVLEVGQDKQYKTVQAAVDAVASMVRPNNERVTIKLDPGTYREQVVVTTPNITLESNGGNRDNTKITWYYGIGYKYYSCVDSVYDPYADYDKFEYGNVVSYWGSAVITKKEATGFSAKGITFENSFNKYMTEEEIADGVLPSGAESISLVRKEGTKVDAKNNTTERAAAYVNYADKVEFLDCSFIGSQDTLYTCNVNYDSYYKNCYIEGQTDFIYGNGDVIFDGCEINLCGYSDTAAEGYLTANANATSKAETTSTDGYIFRNCFVSYSDNSKRMVTASYLGRTWGVNCKVAFLNTSLQKNDMIVDAGWKNMNVDPASDAVTLVEYNTMYNGKAVDISKRVNGAVSGIDADKYSVEKVFIANGWTPAYYTASSTAAATFAKAPVLTSNNDVNKPNPGETLTVGYELNSDFAANDASLISWYAVEAGYNNSSLDKILESTTLLSTSTIAHGNTYQIPMECAGKYIMAVVTPAAVGGAYGEAKYAMLDQLPVSENWVDPSNPGSIAPGSGINIYLAGDSTVKDYSAAGIYNSGKILSAGAWGEFLQSFFNSDCVTVNNYAQGGRSLRSFVNEGKLDTILQNIKKGDYLFVQFGHNDSSNGASYYEDRFVPLYTPQNPPASKSSGFPTVVPTESMLSATPSKLTNITADKYYAWDCGATYKGFLQYYIDKALEKGAIPVIVTPVSRMYYSSDGTIKAHHDANMTDYAGTLDYLTQDNAYVTACKEIYEENKDKGVLLIDAFEITKQLFEDAYKIAGNDSLGAAIMDTGEKTHSNKTGGVIQAGYIANAIQDAGISLSKYVIKPTSVYGEETSGEYIFTIDKTGKFTAKDKTLNEQSYWSAIGQAIFDKIGENAGKVEEGGNGGDKPADTVEWIEEDGVKYWYENGVKQGTEGRGKEIYDPSTDAWYFLDAADGGRMAVSKDVAQPTDWDAYNADPDGYGLDNSKWKWVRYDENGHMVKGWDNNENGAYYFDLITGQMAKGAVEIGNKACYFDEVTGVGADVKWLTIDGVEYWYEGGVRQGYEIGNEAYRGKEIYDPETNAWYWLDNIDGGKKAVSKDVYQESLAGDWGDMTNEAGEKIGKWVRYDAQGHMIKGWSADHLYYFDPVYGTMAKGTAVIDGKTYNFDPVTGILIE